MHTLYREANGERDEVDWLMCFVDDRLIMSISEQLIHLLVGKLFFTIIFLPWLVFRKLAYLILCIICKMSAHFN